MTNLTAALWTELIKARRSRMPLFTALGFLLAPLMGGFFMIILKDPETARRIGILRTKAEVISGSADWPSYFTLLAQATAVGGILLFGLITSWVFGREFVDRTAKDFLALPTPRSSIICSKFIVACGWSMALVILVLLAGLGVGAAVGLPQWSMQEAFQGSIRLIITALLTILLITPVAFAASAGRGYLPPMGSMIIMLVLAQVLGAAGWGPFFPWSIAVLYAGLGQEQAADVHAYSYLIVFLTSLAGLLGTFIWWRYADQTH
jgi:ABC-2 type transport system permease protein